MDGNYLPLVLREIVYTWSNYSVDDWHNLVDDWSADIKRDMLLFSVTTPQEKVSMVHYLLSKQSLDAIWPFVVVASLPQEAVAKLQLCFNYNPN